MCDIFEVRNCIHDKDLLLACDPVEVLLVEGSSVESLSNDLDLVEFQSISGTAGQSPFNSVAWRGSSVP